jgi:sec-independent protein translocase protein TatA
LPDIGPLELIIIVVIALLVFGPGRIGDVGSALGRGMREFRKGMDSDAPAPPSSSGGRHNDATCASCGEHNPDEAKFCVRCGSRVAA